MDTTVVVSCIAVIVLAVAGLAGVLIKEKKIKIEKNAHRSWYISVFERIRAVFADKGLIFEYDYQPDHDESFSRFSLNISGITEYSDKMIGLKIYYWLAGIKVDFIGKNISEAERVILDRIEIIVDPEGCKVVKRTKDGTPICWSSRTVYFREEIERMGGPDKFAERLYQQLADANLLWKLAAPLSEKLKESYESKERVKNQIIGELDKLAEEFIKKPT